MKRIEMNQVIWKVRIAGLPGVPQELAVPRGAEAIHFGTDTEGELAVWVLVTEPKTAEVRPRTFMVVWTGDPFMGSCTYCGTAVYRDLVWHLLEISS